MEQHRFKMGFMKRQRAFFRLLSEHQDGQRFPPVDIPWCKSQDTIPGGARSLSHCGTTETDPNTQNWALLLLGLNAKGNVLDRVYKPAVLSGWGRANELSYRADVVKRLDDLMLIDMNIAGQLHQAPGQALTQPGHRPPRCLQGNSNTKETWL